MDNKNSGVLFNNSDDWKIIQQGKLNINGDDHRIIGVQRKNKDGQLIVEIYKAIGTIKANESKQGDKSPDAKGVITKIVDNGAMNISVWKKESASGNKFCSISLQEFSSEAGKDASKQPPVPITPIATENNDLDDTIPF